jgi:phosphomannomutase/phosphoglucomutase
MISEKIFRAYDIRGIYGLDLDANVSNLIGRAIATYVGGGGKKFIVGKDVRLSSKPLGDALIEGMVSGGLDVEDIGTVTTPLLYFATMHYSKDGGVMVSASHNPPEWNGFKILLRKGFVCMGMGMEDLRDIAIKEAFQSAKMGSVKVNPEVIPDYENYISEKVNIGKVINVVADPGGGSCTVLIPRVFKRLGLNANVIYGEPNGSFSKHPPEPDERTLSELRMLVLEKHADFGVGFVGDGDRAVFIDDKGRIVPSNAVLAMLSRHFLRKHKGAAVVYEVSCSMMVEETIKAYGGRPILSRVGHTYIYEKMITENAILGGETSGHFYFKDIHCFDDAIYTSLKVAEAISEEGLRLSEIVDSLPKYPQIPAKNYDCPDEKKFRVVEDLAKDFKSSGYEIITLDGVKVILEDGWFLIRPSNTQPLIRLTVEAKNEKNLREIESYAEKIILKKIKSLK